MKIFECKLQNLNAKNLKLLQVLINKMVNNVPCEGSAWMKICKFGLILFIFVQIYKNLKVLEISML